MQLHPFQDTNDLLQSVPMPDLVLLRQRFPRPRIHDVSEVMHTALDKVSMATRLHPGARIAITVGSRGIADIANIVRALVSVLHRYGANPFIVPAMGSHGGGTAEGQRDVLTSLGVTEEYIGASILSSLEVDLLGTLPNGLPVYMDRVARGADGIIVLNRIKPHTDFSSPIESGLAKMVAIGLGKHTGALAIHSWGIEGLSHYVSEVAKFAVAHSPILCGIAIIENAYDEVADITVVEPEGIGGAAEHALLLCAKEMMPRLPWEHLDVLVIDTMGKNISGAGMDTNIIGRIRCIDEQKATSTHITNISVHDLTEESHGNAIGLGLADFTTTRLIEKLDIQSFYINCLTAGVIAMNSGKIPMVLPTDREAVAAAIRSCGHPASSPIALARIENTLRLDYILASTASLGQFRSGCDVEALGTPGPFDFATDGSLLPFERIRNACA